MRRQLLPGYYETDKYYYRHSGFPELRGNAIQRNANIRAGIEEAVKVCCQKNKLQQGLKRLRIFAGSTTTAHTAQTPEKVEVK